MTVNMLNIFCPPQSTIVLLITLSKAFINPPTPNSTIATQTPNALGPSATLPHNGIHPQDSGRPHTYAEAPHSYHVNNAENYSARHRRSPHHQTRNNVRLLVQTLITSSQERSTFSIPSMPFSREMPSGTAIRHTQVWTQRHAHVET